MIEPLEHITTLYWYVHYDTQAVDHIYWFSASIGHYNSLSVIIHAVANIMAVTECSIMKLHTII